MNSEELQKIYQKGNSTETFRALEEYVCGHTREEHYKIVKVNTLRRYQKFKAEKKRECFQEKKFGNYIFHFYINRFLPRILLKQVFRKKYRQYGEKYFNCSPYEYVFMQEEFKDAEDIIKYWNHYSSMFQILQDEESRHTFLSILTARVLGIKEYYKKCCNQKYPQYFDKDILKPIQKEVFVDGGAFIGDTAIEMKRSFCKECTIFSYELDERNARAAEENWKKENIENAELRLVGLSDANKTVQMVSAGSNSHIVEGNKEGQGQSMKLVRLDDDLQEKVTFIKLDIEGEEKAAIQGMRRHIQTSHPKLAICIYHLSDDMWKIPELIHTIDSTYQFYIRHYTDMEYETVLYAV